MEAIWAVFMVVVCFAGLLGMYFLPAILAYKKPCAGAIFVVNLFFGWTVVGWIVALVWAMTAAIAVDTISEIERRLGR